MMIASASSARSARLMPHAPARRPWSAVGHVHLAAVGLEEDAHRPRTIACVAEGRPSADSIRGRAAGVRRPTRWCGAVLGAGSVASAKTTYRRRGARACRSRARPRTRPVSRSSGSRLSSTTSSTSRRRRCCCRRRVAREQHAVTGADDQVAGQQAQDLLAVIGPRLNTYHRAADVQRPRRIVIGR